MILTKFGYEANKHPSTKGDKKTDTFKKTVKPPSTKGGAAAEGPSKKLPPNVKPKKVFIEKVSVTKQNIENNKELFCFFLSLFFFFFLMNIIIDYISCIVVFFFI